MIKYSATATLNDEKFEFTQSFVDKQAPNFKHWRLRIAISNLSKQVGGLRKHLVCWYINDVEQRF